MPKLSDYMATYRRLSGKASDVARNLSFAGIALIWIFKMDSESGPKIPKELLLPLGLFAVALLSDLLQYFSGAVIWGCFCDHHEKRLERKFGRKAKDKDPVIDASEYLPKSQKYFFYGKVGLVIIAYSFLSVFIYQKWFCFET